MATIPSAPVSIINEGVGINTYAWSRTSTLMNQFFSDLYSSDFAWERLNGVDPLTNVVSFHYIPFEFPISGTGITSQHIYVGSLVLNATGAYIGTRFYRFYEGFLTIDKFYNNFLDYPPYTRAIIHLPFIGDREIDISVYSSKADAHTIGVYHYIDIVTGNIATMLCDEHSVVHNVFYGNCAIHHPLSSANYSRNIEGIFSAIGGGVSTAVGVASENPVMIASGISTLVHGVAQAAAAPTTSMAGNATGSMGYLGLLGTTLTLVRQSFTSSDQGPDVVGKPCHKYESLLGLSGFTQIAEINLWNFPGQKSELEECLALLKEGVIL